MSPFKTPGKNVPTSSDEFNPDQDTYSILEDITMIDGPPMITDASLPKIESGALRPRESDDEDYQTPPTTPPSEPLRRQFVSDQTESKSQAVSKKMESCFQRPDPVALSSPIRKRPYEESLISLESRKISRGKERTPSQVIYNVKHLSPTEAAVETGFPGYQKPSVRTIDNINKMPIFSCPPTSFDSTMSGSSSKATFSFPAPSTAWTTPNTSFRTEPLVTSFDSVSDSADVTEDLILSRKSKNCSLSNSITKAVPESPRTERMNAGLRRLTTNPDIRKNSMAAEPMDIDGDKPINICKPVDQLGSCTIRGIKVGEYLEKYLLSPPWIGLF